MRLGIIGGTGLVNLDLRSQLAHREGDLIRQDDVVVSTAYGEVPLRTCTLEVNGRRCELVFLQRHHNPSGHGRPPHQINHRANILAMNDSNLDAVVSVCSVGAIASSFPPGKVALASQYVDFTGVSTTFHDDEAVFTSATVPFDEGLNGRLESILRNAQGFGDDEVMHYTYWLTQGPQFETAAEVDAIERLGGHMVGMTMPREAKLAAELDLPYAAICISSNWAAGRDPTDGTKALDHGHVSAQANDRLDPILACILGILE